MGGVAGHMDHLYENRQLTFREMKEIMKAGADGELEAEEKVDGQNLFLSYSIPEGKAKGARNKGHYRSGGLDAAGLATKFANRGGLTKAFTGGFHAFEKAAESLSDQEKENLWPIIIKKAPFYDEYQRKTTRNIPVFLCSKE